MRGGVPLVLISLAAGQLGLTQASASEQQLGVASVYSTQSGSRTASGERLNPKAFTAAHRTLPLGTSVLVTKALAERRRAHFVELYHTKRWKRYYDEEQFLLKMREAIKARTS